MAFDYEREEMPDGELNVTLKLFDADNRVEGVAYNYFDRDIGYEYDPYGRLITRAHRMAPGYGSLDRDGGPYDGCYLTNYFYQNVGDYDTTPLVTEVYQPGNWFEYTYDNVGNIASENRNNFLTTYGYDALGQLTRVNDEWEEYTWTYAYDRGGNIVSKAKYYYTEGAPGTPVETVAYTYGDANWKDKLTAYDGKAITYDAIGNPLTYDGWTYTWKAGRMLHSLVKSGTNAQFAYDHNGQRVKKTVNGVVTEYTLMGKDIVHLKKGADELHFYYDAQGKPGMIRYNGEYYYYLYNLQGDVIAIIDDYANQVMEYQYDPWGKPLMSWGTMEDTLGKLNPFRYRGYVYDEETGLYYLRSRYYNPEWGRFVNCDNVMGTVSCLVSHNLCLYCNNNPIIYFDRDGAEPVNVHVPPLTPIENSTILTTPPDNNMPEEIYEAFSGAGLEVLDNFVYNESNIENNIITVKFSKFVKGVGVGRNKWVRRIDESVISRSVDNHWTIADYYFESAGFRSDTWNAIGAAFNNDYVNAFTGGIGLFSQFILDGLFSLLPRTKKKASWKYKKISRRQYLEEI